MIHAESIVFATNNTHKLKEATQILGPSIRIISLRDIGCSDELPETGNTFRANALQKARYVHEKYGVICFADDSGLEVNALQGAPGVFSARYAGTGATSDQNIDRLLREMSGVEDRSASFRTVIAFMGPGDPLFFEGIIEGTILEQRSGTDGFGYDPVFVPKGEQRTFSEMQPEEKNRISHRAIALHDLQRWLSGIV